MRRNPVPDGRPAPWVGALLILLAMLILAVRPAEASGFGEVRLSSERVKVTVQENLVSNALMRFSVGTVVDYEFAANLPDVEAYGAAKFYMDELSYLGVEAQAFVAEPADVPGGYRFGYELSALIGVSW